MVSGAMSDAFGYVKILPGSEKPDIGLQGDCAPLAVAAGGRKDMDWDSCCALLCWVLGKECSLSLNISTRTRRSFISLGHGLHALTFQCEVPKTDWDAYLVSLAAPAQTTVSTGSHSPAFPARLEAEKCFSCFSAGRCHGHLLLLATRGRSLCTFHAGKRNPVWKDIWISLLPSASNKAGPSVSEELRLFTSQLQLCSSGCISTLLLC